MDGGLSKSFSNDGGLLEIDAEAEMDQRVEEACQSWPLVRLSITDAEEGDCTSKHPHQQVIRSLIAGEEILVDDGLPALLVHFGFKEGNVVVEISAPNTLSFAL